ncbi:hypothetical protein [Fibrella forsythiae]|uniref:Fimbrial protein n=1 Tax=Fibrella forsythiae TaxID=2817061 RepID=A0ABS3JMC0_9BACT|nr:hypothetical protein [Fibrella forsythiae]MBO0951155.1 hypothetical protein [Fibrella forsythiae]
MKKLDKMMIAIAALTALCSGFGATSAQAQLTSGNALVTLTLVDVMAIVVTEPAVALTYGLETDYINGRNVTIPLHLTVSSNRPYDLKVRADGDLTSGLGQSAVKIPIGNVTVQAMSAGLGTTPAVSLSTSDQTFVSNAPGAMAKTVSVKYSTPANSQDFIKTGVYTSTLTYSISAH